MAEQRHVISWIDVCVEGGYERYTVGKEEAVYPAGAPKVAGITVGSMTPPNAIPQVWFDVHIADGTLVRLNSRHVPRLGFSAPSNIVTPDVGPRGANLAN